MTKLEELQFAEKEAWAQYQIIVAECEPRISESRTKWAFAQSALSREEARIKLDAEVRTEIKAQIAAEQKGLS